MRVAQLTAPKKRVAVICLNNSWIRKYGVLVASTP